MRQPQLAGAVLGAAAVALFAVLVMGAAVSVQDKAISVRSAGAMTEYVDGVEFIKRVDPALAATSLAILGPLTYAVCQVTAPIIPILASSKYSDRHTKS